MLSSQTPGEGTMALFKQENRQSDMSEQMTPPLAELPRQTLPGTSREPAIRARAPRGPLPRLVVTAYLEALGAVQSPSPVYLRDPFVIVSYRVVCFDLLFTCSIVIFGFQGNRRYRSRIILKSETRIQKSFLKTEI